MGEAQEDQPLPSSLHWNVADGTLDANRKVAVRLARNPLGPDLMVVFRAAAMAGVAERTSALAVRSASSVERRRDMAFHCRYAVPT